MPSEPGLFAPGARCGWALCGWPQVTDGTGTRRSGTYVPLGSKGRKYALIFDAASSAALLQELAAEASAAVGQLVTVQAAAPEKITLTVNKKRTQAKLKMTLKLVGSADGVTKKGKFKLIKVKGPVRTGP